MGISQKCNVKDRWKKNQRSILFVDCHFKLLKSLLPDFEKKIFYTSCIQRIIILNKVINKCLDYFSGNGKKIYLIY